MEKRDPQKIVCRKLWTGETVYVTADEYEEVKKRIELPGKRLLLKDGDRPYFEQKE